MSSTPETAAPALDESLVGKRFGKYDIVRVIGRGGMGMVYEALNTAIGKRVAMKFVDAEMARNKEAVARFQREAQAASAVESAHIVEIFDSGETDDGLPFIVMELLRGEDLGHRIKRCGRLELAEAAHVTAQILRGLHRAHEAGIVHRDLKPDNIFLVDRDDDNNFAKVLDFGISKVQRRGEVPAHTLTRQGTVLGTPFYMSPEQAQALADVDGRTDLWSVGAILFECLTGRAPHTGATYEQVIINICMKDVDDVRVHNPGVPEAVAKVIAKALQRERADRFQSAREFLDGLASATGGMISNRAGRISGGEGDATTSHPGVGSSPGVRGATPEQALGSAPTLEVQSGGPSKVGWSTSGGTTVHRGRRLYAFVGVGSLVAGAVAALLMLRGHTTGEAVDAASDATAEVRLASNVQNAQFSVDGNPLPNGVLRGSKGERKKVRVEADGYAPAEMEVTLDPTVATVEIPLTSPSASAGPTPAVDVGPPAPVASAALEASAAPANGAKGTIKGKPPKTPPPATAKPTETAVVTAPPPPPPPPKSKGGVAGGLEIKTD